jgi:glycosyltransferase involved in cell wall biosynthesis
MLRHSLASLSLPVSDTSAKKPIVIHHHNNLTMGGTEKMCQIFLKHFIKDYIFDHYVAYKANGDNTREPYFKEIIGPEKMICYESPAKLLNIIHGLKPFILHRYSAGIPEYPFVNEIKQHTKHFVSTSVFGNQDDTIDISKVIYVSKHVQWMAGKHGVENHHVVRNPIEAPYSTENLREELEIPTNAFVFGRIGRDDESIYENINIRAYAEVERDDVFLVLVAPSRECRSDVGRFGIKNAKYIERTTDEVRLSKFYRTIDVQAHARKDGECNSGAHYEGFAHRVPLISHYGTTFQGHLETTGAGGFVVLSGDVEEYTRIMRAFIDKEVDYEALSDNAYRQWQKVTPEKMGNKQLNIYKELLEKS